MARWRAGGWIRVCAWENLYGGGCGYGQVDRWVDEWIEGLIDGWVGRYGRRYWQTKFQIQSSWTFTDFILSGNNMAKSKHLHLIVRVLPPNEFRRIYRGVVLLCHDDASSTNRSHKFRRSVVLSKRPKPIPQWHEVISQKNSVLDNYKLF